VPQLLKSIIGSSLEDHTPLYHFLTHRRPVIILGVIIILPLCFVRSMSKLSWLSYLTVCALVMSVIFVLVALFGGDTCRGADLCHLDEVYEPKGFWWTVQPLMTFCFTYQQVIPPTPSHLIHPCSETILCLQLFEEENSTKNSHCHYSFSLLCWVDVSPLWRPRCPQYRSQC
jgi:amino acid permease